jgi:hypothetical protein
MMPFYAIQVRELEAKVAIVPTLQRGNAAPDAPASSIYRN